MSFIKKLISGSLLSIVAIAGFASLVSTPAYALDTVLGNSTICKTSGTDAKGCAITNDSSITGGAEGVAGFLIQIARLVTYLVGALAVLFLVYGGVMYLTAGGDDGKVKSARGIITNAIIGLIVAIVAFSIVTIVQGLVTGTFING
jgi:hypothetical protein